MLDILEKISFFSVPILIVIILLSGWIKKIKVYEAFTEGAATGIQTIMQILPYLLAMMLAINIFKASGALDTIIAALQPFYTYFDIPKDVLPLLFLRPLSGSGALSYTSQLFQEYGPDSFIGKLASTIQGSTETTFYIIAVYFGAIGIKKYRYAITVGLLADIAGFFAAIFISRLLFLK